MARVTNWLRDQTTKQMHGWRDYYPATLKLPSDPQGEETLGLTINREDGRYLLVHLERAEAQALYECLGKYLS
jgi:hypothetical protein